MKKCICMVLTLTMVAFIAASAAAGGGAEPGSSETPADFSLRYIPESLPASEGTREASQLFQQDVVEGGDRELSMRRAILYSLLLPGLGDYYAGRKDRAAIFFVVDAALWVSFITFRVQGNQREEAYQDFAVQFAGISSTSHSDDFYSTIGLYNTSDEYEAEFKKESRPEIWPDVGYESLERYYLENRVADFEEWAWLSNDYRVDYRGMRSDSKLSYRRSDYLIAALVANRVIASIFAYQAVKSSRKEADTRTGHYRLDFSAPPYGVPGEYAAAVTIVRSF